MNKVKNEQLPPRLTPRGQAICKILSRWLKWTWPSLPLQTDESPLDWDEAVTEIEALFIEIHRIEK